jgi:hypothetical protein
MTIHALSARQKHHHTGIAGTVFLSSAHIMCRPQQRYVENKMQVRIPMLYPNRAI